MASTRKSSPRIEALIKELQDCNNLMDLWERDAIAQFIEPMLRILGWDTDDSSQIVRECELGMGRVDFLMKGPGNRRMPLEAKRPSQRLEDHERQLLLYAFEEGMPFAGLTNARCWWLYLPMEHGNWRSRKFCEIDLCVPDVSATIFKLQKCLSRERFNVDGFETDAKAALSAVRDARRKITHSNRKLLSASRVGSLGRRLLRRPGPSSDQAYADPHPHGTKMRQVFEALREGWVTGPYLTDLTGQKGGWPRWNQKHYVESGRYGEMVLLWKKLQQPSPMHLATNAEAESLLLNPEVTIYPD